MRKISINPFVCLFVEYRDARRKSIKSFIVIKFSFWMFHVYACQLSAFDGLQKQVRPANKTQRVRSMHMQLMTKRERRRGGGGSAYNLIKACSMLLPGCLSMVWAFWPHNAQNIQVILKACIEWKLMLSLSRTHTCSIRLDDNELNRETESLAEPYFVKSLCVCVYVNGEKGTTPIVPVFLWQNHFEFSWFWKLCSWQIYNWLQLHIYRIIASTILWFELHLKCVQMTHMYGIFCGWGKKHLRFFFLRNSYVTNVSTYKFQNDKQSAKSK